MTEYRIDDLARASGTTTRNIRGYQERGLLPLPLRRGRVAIYTEKHLKNLLAINKLLGRGFNLQHIATFLMNPSARIGDALELDEILEEPWSRTERSVLSRGDIEERLGPLDAAALALLLAAGILSETPDEDRFEAIDEGLIDNFGRLVKRGMSLKTLVELQNDLVTSMNMAAKILITAGRDELNRQRGPGWLPSSGEEVAWAVDLLRAMRRAASENAHATLDRALDETLDYELRAYKTDVRNRANEQSGIVNSL